MIHPQVKGKLKTFLTATEVKAMINAADNLRDRAVVYLLADTGCRVSELARIRVEDIDFERSVILIHHLKQGVKKQCPKCSRHAGHTQSFCPKCGADISKIIPSGTSERSRLINVGPDALAAASDYLNARKDDSNLLIPISRQMVYRVVRDLAERTGIHGKALLHPTTRERHYVHPHSFRDALAIDWISVAGDAEGQKTLQEHLGHQSFESTARYLKLAPEKHREIADKVRTKRFGK